MSIMNLQRITLLLLVFSQAMGESSFSVKLPRYEELFYLASPKILKEPDSRAKFLLSQFYNSEGRNHLDVMEYEASQSPNSEDPALIPRSLGNMEMLDCNTNNSIVSLKCCKDTKSIFMGVLKKQQWALRMVDSYGKLSSGLIQGSVRMAGSQDECLDTDIVVKIPGKVETVRPFSAKYCQVGFPVQALEKLAPALPQDSIVGALFGVCLPDSCVGSEIKNFIENGIHLLPFNYSQNITPVVRCPQEMNFDTKAFVSLGILGFLAALVILGTLIDSCVQYCAKFHKAEEYSLEDISKNLESVSSQIPGEKLPSLKEPDKTNCLVRFFRCFSVYRNGKKLLNTNVAPGSLTSVHGLRFLTMMWVMLTHTYIFGLAIWKNLVSIQDMVQTFTFQVIANAQFAVDTFFMLSGLLVTYGIMNAMKKMDGKSNWIYFYVHRIWRLTPPYMLVMMVYVPLFQYWGDGPYWPQTGIEVNYCRDTWWYNILYINNFLTDVSKGMCMPWTWYLSNDMQFYIISPLILIPLYKKPIVGGFLMLVLLLAHLISTGIIATIYEFRPSMFTPDEAPIEYFKQIYVKPYTRIGPYLIGMMYGYLLYKKECKPHLNKYLVTILWLCSAGSALAVIYGLYDYNRGIPMSLELSSLYTAVGHTVWGIAIGWVIYACCSGHGGFVNTILSWKAFMPLSRLSYCIYLVHPVIIQSFYLSQRYTIYLTDFEVVYLFFGHVMMSFGVAFVASMMFEAPMIALEAFALGRDKKKK